MINLANILSVLKLKAKRLGIDKDVTIDGCIRTGDKIEFNFYFTYVEGERNVLPVTAYNVGSASVYLDIFAAGRGKG